MLCVFYLLSPHDEPQSEYSGASQEKREVASRVKEKIVAQVSKYTIKKTSNYTYDNYSSEGVEEHSANIYSNYYREETTKNTGNITQNGISYKENNETKAYSFDYPERKSIISYIIYDSYVSFFHNQYSEEEANTARDNLQTSHLSSITELLSTGDYYEASKGGYAIASSYVEESRTGVAYGSETKEYVRINKTQTVVNISKDYKITSATRYSETITNRDPNTSRWYKKETTTKKETTSYSITYGKRKEGSLAKLIEEIEQPSLSLYTSVLSYGYYDAQNGSFSFVNSQQPTHTFKMIKPSVYHFSFTFKHLFSISVNAFYLEVLYYKFPDPFKNDNQLKTMQIPISDSAFEEVQADGHYLLIGNPSMSFSRIVSFDIELSKDGMDKVTNLSSLIY